MIQSLPYQPSPVSSLTIHAVDTHGNIIATLQGKTYQIEPGQKWIRYVEKQDGNCRSITKYRFKNYGLLDKSQLGQGDDE